MASKIVVEFSEATGQKVFRSKPVQTFFVSADMQEGRPRPSKNNESAFSVNVQNGSQLYGNIRQNFFLSSILAKVQQYVPTPLTPPSATETDYLHAILNTKQAAVSKDDVNRSTDTVISMRNEENHSKEDVRNYVRKVMGDRIKITLEKNLVSPAYAEPIFDILYNQRIEKLYTEVFGMPYRGEMWLKTDLDKRIIIEQYQATKVFESFAAKQLNNRGQEWVPASELEKKMSGEWFAEYVDETVQSIVDKGKLDSREPKVSSETAEKVQTGIPDHHCADVPEILRQAYLSTPNIEQFNSKSFEGLPALFELPKWDVERAYGVEPRLNKIEVDCKKMLDYDYPAVLSHRIKMLKAERGPSRDIQILEDLKTNIEKVTSGERYLTSSVWEANNTARFLALEGEHGLYRAYEKSIKTYSQLLRQEETQMNRMAYLQIPDNMAKNFIMLDNDPDYKKRLDEKVEAYMMDKNSNLERFSEDKRIPSDNEKQNFKDRLLNKVVESFGMKFHRA